jgi:hypothetical protein
MEFVEDGDGSDSVQVAAARSRLGSTAKQPRRRDVSRAEARCRSGRAEEAEVGVPEGAEGAFRI